MLVDLVGGKKISKASRSGCLREERSIGQSMAAPISPAKAEACWALGVQVEKREAGTLFAARK